MPASMDRSELREWLSALGRPRVLVLGDLMLDRYVSGDVDRLSPEAPIPVLAARADEDRLGGGGNVAANLRAMDADVDVVGVVGDDGPGQRLRALLEEIGAETSGLVVDADRPTTEKTRLLTGMHQLLRVDWERSTDCGPEEVEGLIAAVRARAGAAGALVLSDYGKGVLSGEVLAAAIEAARAAGVPTLVDPKGEDYSRYRGATLITPNRKEAERALGRRLASLEDVQRAAQDLIEVADLEAAVITLGPEGMYHRSRSGASGRVPTFARAVFDVTGAGDTAISHLALGLAAGLALPDAVHLANLAAGIVVGRRGAAVVTRSELLAELAQHAPGHGNVLTHEALDQVLADWRARECRIVFTNGCFDIVHAGHVSYLRHARSKGDVLLVGINDDDSVRRMKGPARPINPLADRAAVLAALEMVDAVIPFSEDTPAELIQRVTPDVLVKGEDWADKGVVGREWVESHGGQVYLAPTLPERSTTSILERARRAEAGGGA